MKRALLPWLFGPLLGACPAPAEPEGAEAVEVGGGEAPVGDEATADPVAFAVEQEEGSLLVPGEAAAAGALTLVGPEGACVAQALGSGDRILIAGCPAEPRPWVAFASESPAAVTLAERVAAPAVDAGAAYLGRFGETGFGFRLESPAGDGICPGAPTRITFLHGEPDSLDDARVLGSTTVEGPITRAGSEGVMALVRVDGLLVAVVVWGGDRRRVVTLEGTILLDAQVADGEPCDCCDGE